MSWNAPNKEDNPTLKQLIKSIALVAAVFLIIAATTKLLYREYKAPARLDSLEARFNELDGEMRRLTASSAMLEEWAEKAIGNYPYDDAAKARQVREHRERFEQQKKLYDGMNEGEHKKNAYNILKKFYPEFIDEVKQD